MAKSKTLLPKPIYLGAATRTPIGKFGGSLTHLSAPELARLALKECISRSKSNQNVDFVFLGHARQAGAGPNPARQATIFSGLPQSVPATTINQACASGITAVFSAIEKISLNKAKFILAGGVESMSNTPYLLSKIRFGYKMGHQEVLDGMVKDGFHCPMADRLMGSTVEEFIAKEQKISRKDQDEYALLSQQRALQSWKNGFFKSETFSIEAQGKFKGLSTDEHLREDTSIESLSKLKPVFDTKNGSITAGNSSGITDGSAFLNVTDQVIDSSQVEVLDYETIAIDPKLMGLGPITAIENILSRQGLTTNDIEAFEINEAFAAQVIACERALQIPREKLNPKGGSIAIGHPIGASGARILVTLIHQLIGKKGALGIASLCVSGGQGVALLVRSLK